MQNRLDLAESSPTAARPGRDGIVTRRIYASVPPKVEYSRPVWVILIDLVEASAIGPGKY